MTSPSSNDFRIGIIGLGWPGIQHTRAVFNVPGARVSAACDLNEERRTEFQETHNPPQMYRGYEELIADPNVDAVVVSLPNFLHFPVTLAALQAGKHVLCEKPPTLNTSEMETIRNEAKQQNLTYAFGRQSRFSPAVLAAKQAVASGRLGQIYYARAKWLRLRGIPMGIGAWFTDKARAGGGALIDIGIHALDAVWFIAGCPKPISVTAHTGAHFGSSLPEGVRFDVDDSCFAFIRFAGGLNVNLEVTWAMNMAEDRADEVAWTGSESINTTLFGDVASLKLDPPSLLTTDPTGKKVLVTPLLETEAKPFPDANHEMFTAQMADFVAAARGGFPPTNNADQALDLMRMLGAMYESGATGREVRFDETAAR